MKIIFLSFICLILTTECIAQIDTKNWIVQTDTAYNFSYKRLPDWVLKLPATKTRFVLTTPLESETDQFKENLNCLVRLVEDKTFKISDAEGSIKTTLAKQLQNFNLLNTKYSKWNNAESLLLDYTCTKESEDKTFNIRINQHLAIVNGILYTFTFSSEENSFSKYSSTVTAVLNSFKAK